VIVTFNLKDFPDTCLAPMASRPNTQMSLSRTCFTLIRQLLSLRRNDSANN
jgi:hypothetical protein